jgi:hypothetical protein
MSVVGVDESDIPLVPDPVGAAHDVIDDVGVARVEAFEALRACTALRDQIHVVATFHLENGSGIIGGGSRPRRDLGRSGLVELRDFLVHDLLLLRNDDDAPHPGRRTNRRS